MRAEARRVQTEIVVTMTEPEARAVDKALESLLFDEYGDLRSEYRVCGVNHPLAALYYSLDWEAFGLEEDE